MNAIETKKKVLSEAAEARRKDVFFHQINIDNYRLAIDEIQGVHTEDPILMAFSDQLKGLLASSLAEQAKEQIMLTVIERQLEAMACTQS
jgi:hypothetical protein